MQPALIRWYALAPHLGSDKVNKRRPARTLKLPSRHRPEQPARRERRLDISFYRAAYPESSGISDEELVAQAASRDLPADHHFSPDEFMAYARGVLPQGFDCLGYVLSNPELNLFQGWQAALHYLQTGLAEGRKWLRPFDPGFYRSLYFNDQEFDEERLRAYWAASPSNYGSMQEALFRNGFKSGDWVASFDVASYLAFNTLSERLGTGTQGIVHFVEHGWRAMLPMSAGTVIDPDFYKDFLEQPAKVSDAELYRAWIESGLPSGAPANEAAQLRQLGFTITTYPEAFDWRSYLKERCGGMPSRSNRWDALIHLADVGILERRPLPIESGRDSDLLKACADRFAAIDRREEAQQLYDRLLLISETESQSTQHAADLAFRQGQLARALSLYRTVRSHGQSRFWTWVNGATCALDLGLLDEAQTWIEEGLAAYPRSDRLLAQHLKLQGDRFQFAVSRHAALVRAGAMDTGLELELDKILAAHVAVHRAQFGEQAPRFRRQSGPLRVAFLANQDLPQCTFYRVSQKAEQLLARTVVLTTVDRDDTSGFLSVVATADVALFYRVASDPEVLRCIGTCRALGIPTIYEIDDLVFHPGHFPEQLDGYAGAITGEQHLELRAGVPLVRHAMSICDAGLASTERLAEHMRKEVRTGQVAVHRNGLSRELEGLARLDTAPRSSRSVVTIFYGSGTKAHGRDFVDLLEPALLRLMAEQPEIRFVGCGYVNVSALLARFPERTEHIALQSEREAYLGLLSAADINISVLSPTEFNHCKSEIKWLEAAALGIPSVVSDTAGFREALSPGETVVLCPPEPVSWHAALRRLVRDHGERARLGHAARQHALAMFAQETAGHALEAELRRIAHLPNAATPVSRTLRVLVVNVFFPPQAVGGATRVVRDQIAGLLTEHGEQFELGVLCGNTEMAEPYQIETYYWRGVPVWSINTPHLEHMDWIPRDPRVGPLVGQVLDAFRPDLVHFHCIQRLTVTAIEQVAQRGLPYMVTVHDAWWLSDHQFLVDGLHRLRLPWDIEQYETASNPYTRVASARRRLTLRAALGGAAAVVAVSESFAELYQRAGIEAIQVITNGLPELPPIEESPRPLGRVRIGHIGGAAHHKGFFLLKQALMRGRYDRIQVVAIDDTIPPGESRRERWGASDALILGRVTQERVGWLYGQFDVLAAPSLWPESFGLVAREALAYGRWVIASDRGALGEAVEPGCNGWVIDVGSSAAMLRVLDQLQASPERFSVSPPMGPAARSQAEMVSDYAALWKAILGSTNPGSDRRAKGSQVGGGWRRNSQKAGELLASQPGRKLPAA